MVYREPARREPEAPAPKTPVTRLVVSSYGTFPAIGIFVGGIALSVWIVYAMYASTEIACSRAAPGAVPRCTVTQHAITYQDVAPFDLQPTSIFTREWEDDGSTEVALVTPNGELRAGVTRGFAEETAKEAAAFANDKAQLTWSARRANLATSILMAMMVTGFMAIMAVILKPTRLVLDPDARVLRKGKLIEYELEKVRAAKVEDIDDSEFKRLVLVLPGGGSETVASGRERECLAAAQALNTYLAKRYAARRHMPSELTDQLFSWVDEARRADNEVFAELRTLLESLPLDDRELTREGPRVTMKGTVRTFPVRLVLEKLDGHVAIEVKAKTRLSLDLLYDHDAEGDPEHFARGVSATRDGSLDAFAKLPFAMGRRLVETMVQEDIHILRVGRRLTEMTTYDTPMHRTNPKAHLEAVLALAVDVAEAAHAAGAPT